ncbi:hypothetical protein NIES2104_63770 [Leptolyngbya sp. NIES-2104]|nr:hypothetical protein NIES2104_63770 [Leptolyngbya sp. NIES-2104]
MPWRFYSGQIKQSHPPGATYGKRYRCCEKSWTIAIPLSPYC